MSQDPVQTYPIRWQALRPWLVTLGTIWLLGSVGLGWLVKSFLFLIGLVVITPVVGFFGLRWWISRTLVQDTCPVCQHEFSALNNSQAQCPNCGETLSVSNMQFQRPTSPGTIDVQAVDVTAQVVEDDA
jgi:predicted RNA-binding Zn-ribbon protein involved in translation (DUF1610 family)